MSTTEKQWKVVVDLLQCITAGKFKTQAASDALVKIVNLLEPMARQPAAPTTTWTKLVVGLKVPLHLGRACLQALGAPSRLYVFATGALLNSFLTSARKADIIDVQSTAGSLQDSIRQQLEHSRLIAASSPSEGFSKLLSAAAEHLSAPPFHTLMVACSGFNLGIDTSYKWTHTVALLRVWDAMLGMYDMGELRCSFAAATAPAAWQLISRLWQLVSTEVQQIQEPTAPHHALMLLAMQEAHKATGFFLASWITAWDSTCGEADTQSLLSAMRRKLPSSEQIIQAPQFLQCLAIFEAVLAPYVQVEGPVHAAASSSRSSSSSSDNGQATSTVSKPSSSGISISRDSATEGIPDVGSGAASFSLSSLQSTEALPAWQQSQGLQAVLSSADHKLFELLGTNSQAVLWAAASRRQGPHRLTPEAAGAALVMGAFAHSQVLQYTLSVQQQPQQQQNKKKKKQTNKSPADESSAAQQLSGLPDEQLHLQLACLRLRRAAKVLQSESTTIDTAQFAANASSAALHLWDLTDGRLAAGPRPATPVELVKHYYQQYSGRTEPTSQAGQAAAIIATVELLPRVLQLLSVIQKQLEVQQAASDASSSSSSSSRGPVMHDSDLPISSGGSSATLDMLSLAQQVKLQPAHATLMQLLCQMLRHSVCLRASSTQQQPAASLPGPVAPAAVVAVPQQPPLSSAGEVPPEIKAPEVDFAATGSPEEAYIPPALLQFGPDIINKLESYLRIVAAARVSGTGAQHDAALSLLQDATLHVASMCYMSVGGQPLLVLLSTGYAAGSKEQKRLYSLMFTLSKFSTMMARQPGSKGLPVAAIPRNALAKLAVELLRQAGGTTTPAAVDGSATPDSDPWSTLLAKIATGLTEGSSSADDESAEQSSGEAFSGAVSEKAAVAMNSSLILTEADSGPAESAAEAGSAIHQLPSLVLIERCCLQWAKDLSQFGAVDKLSRQQQKRQAAAGVGMLDQPAIACSGLGAPTLEVLDWLHQPGISAQLSAAGYDPKLVLEVATAFVAGASGYTILGMAEGLIEDLEAYGSALTAFAIPGACNNPSCFNFSGPTERSVVSGRSCKCAGCHTAYYCSSRCQRHPWKQHKPVCKALAEAAVAAAAAAPAAAAAAGQAE